jgi:hypothetical protein
MDNIIFCQYFIGVHTVLPCLTDAGQERSAFSPPLMGFCEWAEKIIIDTPYTFYYLRCVIALGL